MPSFADAFIQGQGQEWRPMLTPRLAPRGSPMLTPRIPPRGFFRPMLTPRITPRAQQPQQPAPLPPPMAAPQQPAPQPPWRSGKRARSPVTPRLSLAGPIFYISFLDELKSK